MNDSPHSREPLPGPMWAGPPWGRSPVALPAIVAIVQVVGTVFAADDQPDKRALDALGIALLVAGPAALALRRRYPAQVLLFTFSTTLAYNLLDYPRGPVFIALIVAFVTAMGSGHRWLALATLVAGYFAFLWLDYVLGLDPSAPGLAEALGVAAWLTALVAFIEIGRGRRERAMEAVRTRREEERRRASEERLRIARELHDVLAHNISLINVQAGVALHLMDEKPAQARSALAAIKEASNDALGELRSVLEILRQGNEQAPRSPTPGLAALDDLVERNRATGMDVRVHVDGASRPLPTGVDRAAFRIVQEALTNVVRHAGPATATVRVNYAPDQVEVVVEDDGRGPVAGEAERAGSGLSGMRERAAALGGRLHAGPRPGGGFVVRATLPVDERVPE